MPELRNVDGVGLTALRIPGVSIQLSVLAEDKALKQSLTLMADGGKCLNIYVPVEGHSDHFGCLGGQDPRSDSSRFSDLWETSRGTGQLLFQSVGLMDPQPTKVTNYKSRETFEGTLKRPARLEKVGWLLVDFLRLKVRDDFW